MEINGLSVAKYDINIRRVLVYRAFSVQMYSRQFKIKYTGEIKRSNVIYAVNFALTV